MSKTLTLITFVALVYMGFYSLVQSYQIDQLQMKIQQLQNNLDFCELQGE